MALAQRGEPVVIPLWPNGAPNDNHLTGEDGHPDPRSVNNVSKPELWVYPAFRPNGTVIIACPGGGYVYLEIEKEGTALAPWFNYIGVTLAVLKYRMPNGHFETSLSDVQEAIKIMRQHTDDWKVNPNKVGVMGCSAGGNLACEAAVQFTGPENRPDFQMQCPKFAESQANGAFTVELEDYIEVSGIDYWIYGHSHYNVDVEIGNTKCVSNQLGYVFHGEHESFDPGKYIEA